MTRVTVSILNFKRTKATISCVHSLLETSLAVSPACQVVIYVADNGSGDEEQRQLQQAFAEIANVHLQLNEENLGFSAGHNRNLAIIFKHYKPDYVWLLNNDCLVDENSLIALLKSAQLHPEVGIWGATLLEQDGETIQCAGGCFYNVWVSSYRQFGQGKRRSQIGQLEAVDYDYIAGASMFFPVATLRDGLKPAPSLRTANGAAGLQWLNETFFLYFEELDLAKRLHSGLRMDWCREALIVHHGSGKPGSVSKQRFARAEYYATLGALKFTRLYYPGRMWFTFPARYVSKCVQLLVMGEARLIGPVTRAYRDFLRA